MVLLFCGEVRFIEWPVQQTKHLKTESCENERTKREIGVGKSDFLSSSALFVGGPLGNTVLHFSSRLNGDYFGLVVDGSCV